jgi:hypothetical protein
VPRAEPPADTPPPRLTAASFLPAYVLQLCAVSGAAEVEVELSIPRAPGLWPRRFTALERLEAWGKCRIMFGVWPCCTVCVAVSVWVGGEEGGVNPSPV